MRHIATNAGAEGSIVVAKVKEMKQDEGFNAATEAYEDLVKAGVIDPAKVVRNALQNASSIASLLLTTEALVSEIPEEKKEAAGGGVALLRAAKALDGLALTGDELVGLKIVRRAIEEPMRHIAANAGAEGSIVVSKVKDMKLDEGFNAATEVYEDLVKAGVIDPAKVVRSALQNASSISSLLLTTEALISEFAEESVA